ncbi:hypothetical protein BGZ46_001625 [Entomortierella lignicola]|nr:hypothetical protein BGZ46_001625 [Entomortierella lignicola]
MIITVAIALGVIKGFILDSSSTTTVSETAATTTATTTTVVSEKSLPEDEQLERKNKERKQQKPPKETSCTEEDIPYVSVADCNACPAPCPDQDHLHYPSYLKMDYETPLLHSMKPYGRHVLISTGKDDWEHSIDEEKDSLAHYLQKAIEAGQQRLRDANDGKDVPRIILTNTSRMSETWDGPGWQVIVLPDNIVVNNVTPEQCDDFFDAFLMPAVGTVGPKSSDLVYEVEKDQGANVNHNLQNGNRSTSTSSTSKIEETHEGGITTRTTTTTTTIKTAIANISSTSHSISSEEEEQDAKHRLLHHTEDVTREVIAGNTTFLAHKWQPKAVVMICSHRKRDKRCGVTAPILKKEFTRILRSKDIYGDCAGDVEIWLISHIGGHKFAGNVIVHKSEGAAIWYGRVEPCHAQAIVDVTIEKGEVIKELYRGSMIGSFENRKKVAW